MKVIERIVGRVAEETIVGTISVSVEKIAEEIAKRWLRNEKYLRSLDEMIDRRSQELWDDLMREDSRKKRQARKHVKKRRRARRGR
jgi:hypothetical protein